MTAGAQFEIIAHVVAAGFNPLDKPNSIDDTRFRLTAVVNC
jgi:hypothetical protein